MAIVIGVRFKKPGKVYYFDPCGLDVQMEDAVVVETVRGVEMGECARAPYEVPDEEIVPPLRKVVRLATEEDISRVEQNRENERRAYDICQEKIAHHKLEMKLVDVEYSFDLSKIVFYFTANGRVDFRALVKDLAGVFKTRIELRQIGVRDEAKMLGGLGPCGRPICCGTFLGDFQPVSIKMAKEQNLSLNPTKISGLCGRLMCCLKYEQDHYEEARKHMPRVGKDVITPDGRGHVIDINVLRETVRVRFQNGDTVEVKEYSSADVQRIMPQDHANHRSASAEAAEKETAPEMDEFAGIDDPMLFSEDETPAAESTTHAEARPPCRERGAQQEGKKNTGRRRPRRPHDPNAEGTAPAQRSEEGRQNRPRRQRGEGGGPRAPRPEGENKPAAGGEGKPAQDKPARRRRPGPRRHRNGGAAPQGGETPPKSE